MNDFVNRTDLLLMMEKRADFDAQPRACKRMVSVVRDYPAARAVPESVNALTALRGMTDADSMTV